jgi:SAM-dependent methyltransferase
MTSEHDRWASGTAYEAYVGRWSQQVAAEFISWLGVRANALWVDVGCGTGALARRVLEDTQPAGVLGIDPSSSFVAFAAVQTFAERAAFLVGDGAALPVRDAKADTAVSGLVLNFVPDPARMVEEMARIVRPGGIVALYVWDYAGEMQMMRIFWDTVASLDPVSRRYDEGMRFSICNPDSLRGLFEVAGLSGTEVRAVDVPTSFASFDDYWTPFLGGTGTAPGYVASLEEDDRVALRERLRSSLPVQNDGSIRLIARAWAVQGRRA